MSSTQVSNWADGNQAPQVAPVPANLVGGSGVGNTIGKPASSGSAGGSISTYGKNQGYNLKPTDPEWKEHLHEVLDMFGNIPVLGGLFNAINAGLYIAEGNPAEALQSLIAAVMDVIPGGEAGSAAKSAGKIGEDLSKTAEKYGVKLAEEDAGKAAEKLAEQRASKVGKPPKEGGAPKEEGPPKEESPPKEENPSGNDKDPKNQKKDGGASEQERQQPCKAQNGVGK
ncbi:hypothetical protein [Paraburkholderia phosphatilytica]|uniref:hypothetical protein n=1 Tax=Paraburkholderia phosphatilytica TaxID=2282883 RepID=UPI000E4EF611|nr:hypothetical protein [Paraburkholderia phosphatilytica]